MVFLKVAYSVFADQVILLLSIFLQFAFSFMLRCARAEHGNLRLFPRVTSRGLHKTKCTT